MTGREIKLQADKASVCAVFVAVPSVVAVAPNLKSALSPREIEILTLASHGKTAIDMAGTLAITERTVAFHINNIVEKLGASNKTHAVALALRQGLID